jgi:tripartite-type tricarboxylate transporter receptor subunit TctC
MLISFNGPLAFGPHLYAKLPYDPVKELAPVIITSSQPNVLAVNAALPVPSAKRFPLLPDIPTIAEAGYPGFEALAWNGILVAAGTPRPIIQRLNSEINAILKEPTVKSALNLQGFQLIGGTPEDFAKLIRSESEKWAPVIRKTGVRID